MCAALLACRPLRVPCLLAAWLASHRSFWHVPGAWGLDQRVSPSLPTDALPDADEGSKRRLYHHYLKQRQAAGDPAATAAVSSGPGGQCMGPLGWAVCTHLN